MATHIKELIKDFLKQKKQRSDEREKIHTITNTILPPQIKNHVHPRKIQKGEIVFLSDSSGATYSLNLIKEKLLAEIQKHFPGVRKITVQTGA